MSREGVLGLESIGSEGLDKGVCSGGVGSKWRQGVGSVIWDEAYLEPPPFLTTSLPRHPVPWKPELAA